MTPAELLAISREPNVAAFLRVIRACEGTAGENGYRMHFGGDLFTSYADHPRKLVVKSGYRSTAAGAYQFLERTWDGIARQYGLPDFTPSMQDAGAVALLIRRKALDAVRAGRLAEAVELTNDEWASLPGSPYGQPVRTMGFVARVFAMHGGVENVTEQSPLSAEPPPSPLDTRPNDALSGFDLPNLHTAPPAPEIAAPPKFAAAPKKGKFMAPVLAALLPSLVSLIPELAKLFGSGSEVSQRNAKVAEKVAEVVVAATGAPNLQGAVESMQGDPAAVTRAREALAPMLELHEAGGGGIAGAREFNAALHAVPFWQMPAFWMSVLLLPLLYYTVHLVLTGNGAFSGELKAAIASSVVTGVLGGIIGFWLGSSFTTSRSRGLDARPTA